MELFSWFTGMEAILAALAVGFVHKRVIGAVGGFLTGGPAGAVGGFIGAGQQQPQAMPGGAPPQIPGFPVPGPGLPTLPGQLQPQGGPSLLSCQTVPPGISCESVGPGWQRHPSNSMLCCPPGQAAGAGNGREVIPVGPQGGCPPGRRPNKSAYFRQDLGFVGKRQLCVKTRRMNPLNPRALDRSIRRLESGKRAARRLSRITVRKKKC